MADRKTVDFFLRGVNEPVALEIPIDSRDGIVEVKEALQKVGIIVDDGGVNVVGGGTKLLAILTPVMHPNDLRAFYDLVDTALKQIGKGVKYPYVRDIKHLPNTEKGKNSDMERQKIVDEIFNAIEESDDGWTTMFPAKRIHISYKKFAEELRKTGHLFAGATISDPYTVASDFVERDIRMATDDPQYALGYATGAKNISGHEQRVSNGYRYGFLYEYERAADQPFFVNTGIEGGKNPGYSNDAFGDNETPVNRFTNPCVGRWFVLYDDEKKFYCVYKIPENDPQWNKWMSQLQTVMHHNAPQILWIERLRKNGDKPQSIVDGVKPGELQKFTDNVRKQYSSEIKNPELFVDHVKRAKKKMDFELAQQKLKKLSYQSPQVLEVIGSEKE